MHAASCCCLCCNLARRPATHPERGVIPVAEAQQLHCQGAGHAQHGPAAVDDLGLLEALQAVGVLGQAQGVEACGVQRGAWWVQGVGVL
jgi:hypothetical protein